MGGGSFDGRNFRSNIQKERREMSTSPTPWKNDQNIVVDNEGQNVCVVSHRKRTDEEDDALAELIVHAVNCHAGLVAAMDNLITACDLYDKSPTRYSEHALSTAKLAAKNILYHAKQTPSNTTAPR